MLLRLSFPESRGGRSPTVWTETTFIPQTVEFSWKDGLEILK